MKTKRDLLYATSLVLSVFSMGILIGSSGFAAESTSPSQSITSNIVVQSTTKTITDDEWRSLSLSAGYLLKHVDQARFCITNKDKPATLQHLEKGITLTKIIETVLPPVKVQAEIKAGTIQYKEEEELSQMLVPVYNEILQYDILAPVIHAKGETKTNVVESGLDYSTEYLNVYFAKQYLTSAQRFVNEEKWDEANTALRNLFINAVVFQHIEKELPVSRSVKYLSLAERAFNDGRDEESVRLLQEAANALDAAVASTETQDRVLLQKNRENIEELAAIVHDQTRKSTFRSKLSAEWNKLTSWLRKR